MVLTIQFIADSFHKFNKLYWNGTLRTPKFEITSTKSFLGQFCYGSGIYKIRISNRYQKNEKEYQNTILHEMIHQYIRQNNIKDTRTHHGKVFFAEAARINKFGWHISRCDNSVRDLDLTDGSKEKYLVCCYRCAKGYNFLFVLNPSKINYYREWLNSKPNYFKEFFFFESTDTKSFSHLRKCQRRINGKYITKDEYENYKSKSKDICVNLHVTPNNTLE